MNFSKLSLVWTIVFPIKFYRQFTLNSKGIKSVLKVNCQFPFKNDQSDIGY